MVKAKKKGGYKKDYKHRGRPRLKQGVKGRRRKLPARQAGSVPQLELGSSENRIEKQVTGNQIMQLAGDHQ